MAPNEQKSLGAVLWGIADKLRSGMNADDFRDYMLSFLFLKYLSDRYEQGARERVLAPADWEKAVIGAQTSQAEEDHLPPSPLAWWYTHEDPETVRMFEDEMRRQLHYLIQPEYLWSSIAELARINSPRVLETLKAAFSFIEEQAFSEQGRGDAFAGLFSEINLDSEKLGKTHKARNDKLIHIINDINQGLESFTDTRDSLGDAYEYLIGKFAAGGGKKAGEFYTPQPLSDILSGIVTLDGQNPETGLKNGLNDVLDFACGSGSLLLNIRRMLVKKERRPPKLWGQESNITTYNLARMNMLLHGVPSSQFELFHGDSLRNQWEDFHEIDTPRMPTFQAVVANPPFSLKWQPDELEAHDKRFANHGLAPKSAADFAFVLHGFTFLDRTGTMAVLLPHGVLFRGGAEGRIRQKLLKDQSIDTVIGLPKNLFSSTGIPVCILVLKKCTPHKDVLFINAEKEFKAGKNQNELTPDNIRKIIDTYRYRREEERYSRRVAYAEIEANDSNLNISRYVSTAEPEPQIDLAATRRLLLEDSQAAQQALERLNKDLVELGLEELP
ncbi:type I restriction-modification system subunit M [Oecophyllibacter saccharovorans]|uniref:type I restriction-modification system subunit M n=1 Tax=Oecophyllibacter saccharovorans TaxID=2558360 RepID=UPI00116CF377|nr:type I restriction-modification system subunit M [Oecophyllibacter saccharovorans]TPW36654.1 type I restriction-modification system subunit M [Oecophyllibacter saccharovorans]